MNVICLVCFPACFYQYRYSDEWTLVMPITNVYYYTVCANVLNPAGVHAEQTDPQVQEWSVQGSSEHATEGTAANNAVIRDSVLRSGTASLHRRRSSPKSLRNVL